ncbi:MAG: M28 family metallopeptidase [Gaiellaceae bacterium]
MKVPTRPRPRPAKPRPGSLERPLNARIYRGAWFVVVIPVLIVAFSVARQEPLVVPSLSSNYDPDAVVATMNSDDGLARSNPDRSPGAASSVTVRNWIVDQFEGLGLKAKVDLFDTNIPGFGKVGLSNVSATVRGRSATEIVILAHRDNSGQGPSPNDNASGTAAMLELARAYQNRPGYVAPPEPAHSLVFLSTDGGDFGAIGAARFAKRHSIEHRIAAVIVLDSIAGSGRPRILFNGDTTSLPAPVLVATANQILNEQPGAVITHTSPVHQLLDLAFPFSLYEQAPFVARGIPAVTFTTAGDRYPDPLADTVEKINANKITKAHLTQIGRATEELIAALDQGVPEPRVSSASYIYLGGRFLHGWAIQLLLIASTVPALVAVVDLFARCRRRGIELWPAFRSFTRRLGFWFSLLAIFLFFARVGFWPRGAGRPLSPDSFSAASVPLAALVGFAFLVLGAWFISRDRLLPRTETGPEQELAGYALALLAVAGASLAVAWFNSYALLFLLPPLHVWIWMPQVRRQRPWSSLALLAVGLLGPLLIFLELAAHLDLGLSVFWYVPALAAVGFLKFRLLLVAAVLAAAGAQLAALSVGRYAPYPAASDRPALLLPLRFAHRVSALAKHWNAPRAGRHAHSD